MTCCCCSCCYNAAMILLSFLERISSSLLEFHFFSFSFLFFHFNFQCYFNFLFFNCHLTFFKSISSLFKSSSLSCFSLKYCNELLFWFFDFFIFSLALVSASLSIDLFLTFSAVSFSF